LTFPKNPEAAQPRNGQPSPYFAATDACKMLAAAVIAALFRAGGTFVGQFAFRRRKS
jgi:hypothetical protein